MANHYQNGGRNVAVPEENRPSWRPQDQPSSGMRSRGNNEDDHDYRSWRDRNYRDRDDERQTMDRDPRRWEGSRGSELGHAEDRDLERSPERSTERYGQGQSGYNAGRYGNDRSQQIQSRNEMVWSGHQEERGRELGTDDRFSRGSGSWTDRSERGYDPERYGAQGGYGGGRGFEAERIGGGGRGYDQRMGYDRGDDRHDQRMGYQGGYGHDREQRGQDRIPGMQEVGYRGGFGRGQDLSEGFQRGTQDQRAGQRGNDGHVHQGTGPHRGKGPMGYQRSDERIREMVCDALADDDMIDASQIHVTVKDGEVTLSGVVDSRRIKREAEDCVSSVSGVRDVQIQLRIKDDKSESNRSGSGSQSAASQSAAGQSTAGQSTASQSTANQGQGSSSRDSAASAGKPDPDLSSTTNDKKHRA